MDRQVVVRAEELTVEHFAPYGQAVLMPDGLAPKRGQDWDCWDNLARFGSAAQRVGCVWTRPTNRPITHMERHLAEVLAPVTAPVIQAMALPDDLADPHAQPDAHTVRAFIIRPGQCIVMADGAWHWAAIPWQETAFYYFIFQPSLEPFGLTSDPWVPFRHGESIRIEVCI